MNSYTFSEARQNFATVLEQVSRDGVVRIFRRDGQSFLITPEVKNGSPLDVVGVQLNQPITTQEILDSIQEGRKVY